MISSRRFLVCSILAISSAALSQESSSSAVPDQESVRLALLDDAGRLIEAGNFGEAISEYIDKVLADFDATYGDVDKRFYCARSQAETLFYLLTAATDKQAADVLSSTWADAHYMKGYALLETGRLEEAKASIESAVTLSPGNAQYLSELGHVYSLEEDWPQALEYFETAEKSAEAFSPPEVKASELGRARRGVGYVLVELGRLDEAEDKYLQCLAADPNDVTARSELEYVRSLRDDQ